jgi:hypothetical protein
MTRYYYGACYSTPDHIVRITYEVVLDNKGQFSQESMNRLRQYVQDLKSQGCHYIIPFVIPNSCDSIFDEDIIDGYNLNYDSLPMSFFEKYIINL